MINCVGGKAILLGLLVWDRIFFGGTRIAFKPIYQYLLPPNLPWLGSSLGLGVTAGEQREEMPWVEIVAGSCAKHVCFGGGDARARGVIGVAHCTGAVCWRGAGRLCFGDSGSEFMHTGLSGIHGGSPNQPPSLATLSHS